MNPALSSYLLAGIRGAGWTTNDLWVASFAIGGDLDANDLDLVTSGDRDLSPMEYDVLAAALNERYQALGLDHPMDPWAQLPGHLTI